MKIIVVGATGTIGRVVAEALGAEHEVIRASRRGDVRVDLSDPQSISAMYESTGRIDAVVSTAGSGQFGPLEALTDEAFDFGLGNKLMGQVNLVRFGQPYLNDHGSFTLTSGILAREPNANSVLITTLNAAVEGFASAAALNLSRDLRLNAVSPPLVHETALKLGWGNGGVPVRRVAELYVAAVVGDTTGKVISMSTDLEKLHASA